MTPATEALAVATVAAPAPRRGTVGRRKPSCGSCGGAASGNIMWKRAHVCGSCFNDRWSEKLRGEVVQP